VCEGAAQWPLVAVAAESQLLSFADAGPSSALDELRPLAVSDCRVCTLFVL